MTTFSGSSAAPSPEPFSDAAAVAATHLESCTDSSTLRQIHTLMLRRHLLRGPFHWNALLRCHLRLSGPLPPLLLLPLMLRSGVAPDSFTLPIAFKSVALAFSLPAACQLHALALKFGLHRDEFSESGIISCYSKSGEFDDAVKVFDENIHRKLGSWNAIINGFAQGGRAKEAVSFFIELRRSGLVPDDVTMVSIASASGALGDLFLAQQVHKCAMQAKSLERIAVMRSNSLIDMYCKCGRTDFAYKVFDRMPCCNVSSYTAMIMGLATHGQENRALELFKRMMEDGVRPNHVTMVGVLAACAHGGLVEEGMEYFDRMADFYGVKPTVAHYGCVVDMLGKVGRLAEARGLVEVMPMRANAVIWGTMLGACEKHGEVEIGEWAAGKLLELEPGNDGVYVVLSNIYAGKGMWPEVQRLRRLMWVRRVAKTPGYSLAGASN